jgi:hypothetical protein
MIAPVAQIECRQQLGLKNPSQFAASWWVSPVDGRAEHQNIDAPRAQFTVRFKRRE